MKEGRYELAGWLTLAYLALSMVSNISGALLIYLGMATFITMPIIVISQVLSTVCIVYAYLTIKNLLNVRFDFHRVDALILLSIIFQVILAGFIVFMRFVPMHEIINSHSEKEVLAMAIPFMLTVVAIMLPLSLFSLIYGIKLLKLNDSLFGFLKPYAFTQIIGSALILTFFLAPLGGIVLTASDILQALILIKSGRQEVELEFV